MLTTREQLSNGFSSAFTFFLAMQGVVHLGELWQPLLGLTRSDLSEYWVYVVGAVIVGISSRNTVSPKRFATMGRPPKSAD